MPKVWNHRDRNIPKDAINIDRRTKYGNRYRIGPDGSREEVIAKHEKDFENLDEDEREKILSELRGKDLVCWCKPKACHGDIYFRLANKGI